MSDLDITTPTEETPDSAAVPADQLDTTLLRLAGDRRNVEEQKATIALLQVELEETELFSSIRLARERLTLLTETAKVADGDVRGLALMQYERDPAAGKAINAYVSITENSTFEFDEEVAIGWASEHAQGALKLDKPAIKKIAKVMPVDGVGVGTENKVRIASDLSSYLVE